MFYTWRIKTNPLKAFLYVSLVKLNQSEKLLDMMKIEEVMKKLLKADWFHHENIPYDFIFSSENIEKKTTKINRINQ